jgi:hypothetical protein
MVVLGVVLVLLAFAVGVLLVAGTASLDGTVDVSVPGGTLSLPPLTFLVLGMVVITVFWLGWAILRAGVRRSRRRRHEAKEAEARRVAEEKRLKEEFAARERALLDERDEAARSGRTADRGHGPADAGGGHATTRTDGDAGPGDGQVAGADRTAAPRDAPQPTAPGQTAAAAETTAPSGTTAHTGSGAASRTTDDEATARADAPAPTDPGAPTGTTATDPGPDGGAPGHRPS